MDPQVDKADAATQGRRRSSVAYDPARDIFTEIHDDKPDPIQEETHPRQDQTVVSSSPVQSSRPRRDLMTSPEPQKRQRDQVDAGQAQTNGSAWQESPPKKLKQSEPTINSKDNVVIGTQSEQDLAVKIKQPTPQGIQIRDNRSGNTDSNRPSPTKTRRRRPSDEPPRDLHRVRERPRRRSRSPSSRVPTAYRRRSPPRLVQRQRTRSPSPIRRRSPSPIRPRDQLPTTSTTAPVRRGRNLLAEKETLQAEREARQRGGPVNHGVQSAVNNWYNAVPEYVKERGRDWRRNESAIKGLRSYNNWVKSCIIQKFSPQVRVVDEAPEEELGWGEQIKVKEEVQPLKVLDIGCGKGGDLGKWEKAPHQVGLYVGLDPADTSISQASDRYRGMWRGRRPKFEAQFAVKDCFGEWIGDLPIVQQIGIDPNPQEANARWGKGGGFDIVTMMFSMHYSFESEEKVMMMLRNVAGALKKGGRFIGVCPNSDVLTEEVQKWFTKFGDRYTAQLPKDNSAANGTDDSTTVETNGHTDATMAMPETTQQTPSTGAFSSSELAASTSPCFGNSIYSVRFPPPLPSLPRLNPSLLWRPPYANKYTYFIAEAVDVPEFVVPWPAFRAKAEDFGLEQRYRKPFLDIWHDETNPATATPTSASATGNTNQGGWGQEESAADHDTDVQGTAAVARELELLGVRMGVVRQPGGPLLMSEEEKEAVAFYHAFCFVKT